MGKGEDACIDGAGAGAVDVVVVVARDSCVGSTLAEEGVKQRGSARWSVRRLARRVAALLDAVLPVAMTVQPATSASCWRASLMLLPALALLKLWLSLLRVGPKLWV